MQYMGPKELLMFFYFSTYFNNADISHCNECRSFDFVDISLGF